MEKEVTVVYMVAGMSSRFSGKIKQFAKVGLNGETLIECSVDQAIKSGASKIIFIVGEKTESGFKEMFGNNYKDTPIEYAFQSFDPEKRDKPWGTTDALCCAKEIINTPFIVCNGDDIYGENTFKILIDHLKNSEDKATIGYKLISVVPETGTVNRGIFETDADLYLKKITETFDIEKEKIIDLGLTPDTLCSQNIFALDLETLSSLNTLLKNFRQEHEGDRKKECLLPEDLSNLIQEGKIKMKLLTTPDTWLGITNPEDEEIVREELRKLNNKL